MSETGTGQSTDKIRMKMLHDRPVLSWSDKMAGWKCAAAWALSRNTAL